VLVEQNVAVSLKLASHAYVLEPGRVTSARDRIEVGIVVPSDLAASYFTTTVAPTDTR
jgi:ABC-type branched-subunit amino acid transport system ATPase component